MKRQIKISFIFTFYATLSLGVVYPVTLSFFRHLIPSTPPSLLEKPILQENLFQARPSIPKDTYYGASNLALTSLELAKQVETRLMTLKKESPNTWVPRDLLFTSASGYDPDISLEAAQFQIARIAKARSLDKEILEELVNKHTQPKLWGFMGTTKVNVVELNRELGKRFPNAGS